MQFPSTIAFDAVRSAQDLARVIDHTVLKAETTSQDIKTLCAEARTHGFLTVCVNPSHVPLCVRELKGSQTHVITVVGFPLGAMMTVAKAFEAAQAVAAGAEEIDMVINVGALKSGENDFVRQDIKDVVLASQGVPVKVIIETALLTDEEKIRACVLSVEAGARYVKTSTGFAKSGATVEDIALMRKTVGDKLGVKASGGVRTLEQALALIKAGASRIGASASVTICQEAEKHFSQRLS